MCEAQALGLITHNETFYSRKSAAQFRQLELRQLCCADRDRADADWPSLQVDLYVN